MRISGDRYRCHWIYWPLVRARINPIFLSLFFLDLAYFYPAICAEMKVRNLESPKRAKYSSQTAGAAAIESIICHRKKKNWMIGSDQEIRPSFIYFYPFYPRWRKIVFEHCCLTNVWIYSWEWSGLIFQVQSSKLHFYPAQKGTLE